MKRICFTFFLTVLIMDAMAVAAWAGPVSINVKADSWSINVKNNISPSAKNIDLNCFHGFNDKLMLILGYGTETQVLSLGGALCFRQ